MPIGVNNRLKPLINIALPESRSPSHPPNRCGDEREDSSPLTREARGDLDSTTSEIYYGF